MYDDIVYVTLLLVSILWGKVTRSVSDTRGRKWTSSLFGLGLVGLVSGYSSLHPLFSVALHTCLVKLSPRRLVHWINFIFGFAHLFLFRSAILDSPPAHTNAIQMIMTLKLMGLAFEIHDDTGLNPNAEDIFHYAFAHSGILTGPYYRFRTFQDLYETPYALKADCETLMLQRIIRVPFYLILFLVSGYFFPISAVLSENFYESTSFWWRLFYMTPVFFNFRMRLYIGFILSECSCIMAGLGAYPCKTEPKPGQGPSKPITKEELESDIEINFETIHNIDEFKTESVTTMRDALKTWNMTVQWWLAANVYRRLPGYSREFRAFVVMMVSSIWHGVYAGYYLSLGSVPFVLAVEDLYERIVRRHLDQKTQSYDCLAWFMRFQWFSYLGMGFQLLSIDKTMRFWNSVFYIGHWVLPVFYLLGLFVVRPLVRIVLKKEN